MSDYIANYLFKCVDGRICKLSNNSISDIHNYRISIISNKNTFTFDAIYR